jgi:predicted nuclease with TOPRIM domain
VLEEMKKRVAELHREKMALEDHLKEKDQEVRSTRSPHHQLPQQ